VDDARRTSQDSGDRAAETAAAIA